MRYDDKVMSDILETAADPEISDDCKKFRIHDAVERMEREQCTNRLMDDEDFRIKAFMVILCFLVAATIPLFTYLKLAHALEATFVLLGLVVAFSRNLLRFYARLSH